jgi:hypothetical protein
VGRKFDRVAWRSGITSISVTPSALNGLAEEPICVGQDRVRRSPVWGVADADLPRRCAWPPVAGVEGQRYA